MIQGFCYIIRMMVIINFVAISRLSWLLKNCNLLTFALCFIIFIE